MFLGALQIHPGAAGSISAATENDAKPRLVEIRIPLDEGYLGTYSRGGPVTSQKQGLITTHLSTRARGTDCWFLQVKGKRQGDGCHPMSCPVICSAASSFS